VTFTALPASAAWRHGGSRAGFEACAFTRRDGGYLAVGSTSAIEGERAWWVQYEILLDTTFTTRRAVVRGGSTPQPAQPRVIEADGHGHWFVDGHAAPELEGCLDIDLESSAMTNTLALRRLRLGTGESAPAPAAYVRVEGLSVERLEQEYTRRPDGSRGPVTDYRAPAFSFHCRIEYDWSGLVVHYPGIAQRVG
jgi:hypothetical protein